MKIASLNVQLSLQRRTDRLHLKDVLHRIDDKKVDFLLLQEIWFQKISRLEELLRETDLRTWKDHFFSPCSEVSGGIQGNLILSRFTLGEKKVVDLSQPKREERKAQVVVSETGDGQITLINVHLGLARRERKEQLRSLGQFVSHELSENRNLVVGGDFNCFFQKDFERMRESAGLFEYGRFRTFPSGWPWLRLDRILYRNVKAVRLSRLEGLPWTKLSDHLPLIFEFEMKQNGDLQ